MIYVTRTRVRELDMGEYLRVGYINPEKRGFVDTCPNLDTDTGIRHLIS